MPKQVLTELDFNNVGTITNLPDAVAAQSPATLNQLRAAIEGLAWKDNARVATQSNLNLASPGSTIDGVTMATNDRVLVRNQTTASQNGVYIWNGASTAMTRALDMSVSAEFTSAVVPVDSGTDAGTQWRQTAVAPTVDSTSITFTAFGTSAPSASETSAGIAELATQAETDTGTDDARIVTPLKLTNWAGRKLKFSANVGDGSATSYTITHNLGTRDVQVAVYRNSGNYDEVLCDINHATINTITLIFANAPSSNQFRVVVLA